MSHSLIRLWNVYGNRLLKDANKINTVISKYSHETNIIPKVISKNVPVVHSQNTNTNYQDLNIDWKSEMQKIKRMEDVSVLEPCTEDISHYGPAYLPSYNFAKYVNDSPTLQELVKLGVDLSKIEKHKGISEFILRLDFERDIKKYVLFLHDIKIPDDRIGYCLTRCPQILQEDIDNLIVRVNYLRSKRFSFEMITSIISRNPKWLLFRTQDIDNRLGFFQEHFALTGPEVRSIAVKQPKLITFNLQQIKVNAFAIKEEMGFEDDEIKTILLAKPVIWIKNQVSVLKTFEYVHKVMKISHKTICTMPEVLTSRVFRIKQRHMFLEKLGRAQYDPEKENYVSLTKLVTGTDSEFCENVAKTSVQIYNKFLKSF